MRHLFLLISILATLLPLPAFAGQQLPARPPRDTTETNRPAIIPFLEGTDVFWTLVKSDALDKTLEGESVFFPNKLEGNIFPHLVFYQNFTDILEVDDQKDRTQKPGEDIKERAMVFSATPAVRIRMLRDRSAPVRTPSYMPRGNFQFFFVRGLKDGRVVKDAPAEVKDQQKKQRPNNVSEFFHQMRDVERVSIWELHVIGGHHSNGQDGCLSLDQRLIPPPPAQDSECIPPGVVPTASTINRIDGSFSSAFFFRFGSNYSKNWMRLDSDTREKKPETGAKQSGATESEDTPQAYREARFSAEYEWHPKQLVTEQMRDIYGRHRANLGAAYATRGIRWCQRRFEVSGGVIWNPGVVDPELDWTGHVQASCFPWNNGGWGFFARWYAGQDYYNVGFLDDINRLQVGMTFNQADFFKFRRRPNNDGQHTAK